MDLCECGWQYAQLPRETVERIKRAVDSVLDGTYKPSTQTDRAQTPPQLRLALMWRGTHVHAVLEGSKTTLCGRVPYEVQKHLFDVDDCDGVCAKCAAIGKLHT